MPSERERELQSQGATAIEERVLWHTVGINPPSARGDAIATGVLLRYGGRPIIATAGHVIREAGGDDWWFLYRTRGRLPSVTLSDVKQGRSQGQVSHRFQLKVNEIRLSHETDDLGVFFLDPSDAAIRTRNLTFHDIDYCPPTANQGDQVVVCGFPYQSTRPIQQLPGGAVLKGATPYVKWSNIAAGPEGLGEFDATRHLLVHFDIDDEGQRYVSDPHGVSGGGIWMIPAAAKSGIWQALILLAGIQIAWYKDACLLKGTKCDVLLSLLSRP